MAKAYAIETVFKLIDQVSAPTSKIGKALDSLGIKSKNVTNALKHDFDKAAERVDRLGKSIKKAIKGFAIGAINAVRAGIGIATKQFIEFDDALHKAGAIFSDLNPQSADFSTRLKTLGKEARAVAAATEFNAQQTAEALATMAMAGIRSDQAVALLPKVADMATAAGIDINAAVGMAADSLNVFGKMTDDPLQLAENLQYVSDIMVKTASLANMDITMMYQAIGAGGGEFKKANQRIEDFGAAIAVLAANNIKGSEAGNSINTMMVRLAAPAKAGEEALKKLGIRTKDAQGNILNFTDIIGQLNVAFKGMGTAVQADYIDAIFGKNRYQAASALITAGAEGLQNYSRQLEEAAGAAAQAAAVMRQSLSNRIEVLKSSLTELGFKFVDAFAEKGGAAIEKITEAVSNFDITPIVNMAQSAVSAIGRFVGMLMGAVKIAWQFRGVIIAIAAPIAAYNLALMGITIALQVYHKWQGIVKAVTFAATLVTKGQTAALAMLTAGSVAHGIAQKGLAIATGIATAAQWAFNVALTANPIGIIIVAIGALIAIIVLLVKNWDKVTAAIKNNANKVMTILTVLFGPIGIIISMIKEIASNWGKIKEALSATGLFDKIKEIGTSIKNFIQPAIDWLIGVWETVKNAVSGFFSYVVNGIKSFFEPAISWIVNAWHTATSAIGNFFKGIFDAVYNFVKPALDWLSETWQKLVSFFKDNAIVNAIKVIGGTLISGLLAPIQGLLEILSYIPGLGHLAGKGAEKIQELRNFLKGVDGATVTADVNMPESVNAELAPRTGTDIPETPDIGSFNADGSASGRSRLHGVVDISGGASAALGGASSHTTTGTDSPVNTAPVIPEIVTRNLIDIASILRKIDGSVFDIARNMPTTVRMDIPEITAPETATRTSAFTPIVNMGGAESEDGSAREISPITQAERTAYSLHERRETVVIEVAAEKGTAARIVSAPPDIDIQLVNSGGNA